MKIERDSTKELHGCKYILKYDFPWIFIETMNSTKFLKCLVKLIVVKCVKCLQNYFQMMNGNCA